MGRSKVESLPPLKDWDEVDNTLTRIGEIEFTIENVNNRLIQMIKGMTAAAKKEISGLPDEKKRLEKQAAEFCQYHRSLFGKNKSKILPAGKVGFRWTPGKVKTLKGWTEKKAVEILRKLRKRQFIRYRDPVLNKDIILESGFSNEKLAAFGLSIEKKEEFFYELKKESAEIPSMEE